MNSDILLLVLVMRTQVGRVLRNSNGTARLKFTTQSYLVSLYLDCPPGMGLHCPDAQAIDHFVEVSIRQGSAEKSWC